MRKAILLLVLLLGAIPLPATGALAQGDAARAVWWGPTGMMEGWHVRVPVVVHNPTSIARWDATVGEDLDLRAILLDAGWPSGRVGQGRVLQVFELDPDSVRVVEYRALGTGTSADGLVVGEVPSRSREGFLERTGNHHPRTSPDVHVEWVLPGKLDAGASRYFMIHVDTLANGDKPRADYPEASTAPLDARYWISRGTRLVGQAATLAVVGLEDDTSVVVSTFSGGRAQQLPGGALTVSKGQVATLELNSEPALVQVDADRPVVAVDAAAITAGPVPSVDGAILGTRFDFGIRGYGYLLVAPGGGAQVTRVDSAGESSTLTLTPGRPALAVGRESIDFGREQITSDAPLLVLANPGTNIVQYPSTHGAPFGSTVVARPIGGGNSASTEGSPPCIPDNFRPFPGEAKVVSLRGDAYVRARELATSALALPADAANRPEANAAYAGTAQPWTAQVQLTHLCPLLFHATSTRAGQEFDLSERLAVFGSGLAGGAAPVHASAPGGEDALRFHAFSRVHVVAPYNATQVAAEQAGRAQPVLNLGAGDAAQAVGARSAPAILNATKPILLVPTVGGGFFAGLDESLRVSRLGPAQHRGFLLSLEPEDAADTEPLSGITSPGREMTFSLVVRNLARDAAGRPVADTAQLSVPPPTPGWKAELSATELRLDPGAQRRVELKVTPPEDASEGARLTIPVSASSLANPGIVDRLTTVTLVRATADVDLWFDREGGPKVKTITADPDAPREVSVVVKNRATIPDRITLRIGGVSSDWGVAFDAGSQLLDVPLEAGEAREVTLDVIPPATNGSQSLLQVSAESSVDSSAAAQVLATLRVRADLRIALEVQDPTLEVQPGQTATFEAVFHNRGTDAVGIRIGTSGARPPGWEAPTVRVRGYDIDEISDLPPGGELPFQLLVPVPANASRGDRSALRLDVQTIPQFVGDPVLRESVDLLALAAFRHDLRDESAATAFLADAEGAVHATRALTNHGNGPERLRIVPRALPEGATFSTDGLVDVPVGERGRVSMDLRLPASTLAGTYAIQADVVSDDGHAVPWRYNVSVPELRRAALDLKDGAEVVAGLPSALSVQIVNEGNVPLEMPPRLVAPPGWNLSWSGVAGLLGPGEARLATLVVSAPHAQPDGDVALRPDGAWGAAPALGVEVRHVRLEPRVEARGDGTTLVAIHNAGSAAASDVEVALLDGENVVDRVQLRRIAAGGNASAILAAPREGAFVVRVAGAGEAGGDAELPVEVGRAPRAVPAAALPILAAAALAAALSARRRG